MDTKKLREILQKFSSEDINYGMSIDQAIKEIQELCGKLVEPYCDLGNAGCEFHSCKGCAHHKVGKLSTPRLTDKDKRISFLRRALERIATDMDLEGEQMMNIASEALNHYPEPCLMDWEKVLPKKALYRAGHIQLLV